MLKTGDFKKKLSPWSQQMFCTLYIDHLNPIRFLNLERDKMPFTFFLKERCMKTFKLKTLVGMALLCFGSGVNASTASKERFPVEHNSSGSSYCHEISSPFQCNASSGCYWSVEQMKCMQHGETF